MAIDYKKVNWDTTKYVNPTNMNNMDNGIKSACDGVDRLDGEMAEANAEINGVKSKLDNKTTTSRDITDSSEGGLLIHHIDGSSVQNGTPTPTSPVAIDSVSVKVKTQGKNLIPYPYFQTTQTVSGITTVDNGDGTLEISGTATANVVFFRLTNNNLNVEIPLDRKKYKLVSSARVDGAFVKSDGTSQTINNLPNTVIDNTDGIYVGLYALSLYVASGTTLNTHLEPMLVEVADDGTYPTTFEKGYTSNADTSLVLRSIGDIKDELIFEDNKYKVLRRIATRKLVDVISTCTRSATNDGDNSLCYRFDLDTISSYSGATVALEALCNINETSLTVGELKLGKSYTRIVTGTKVINAYISLPLTCTTVALAQTFVTDNDVVIDYVMPVPTVEELTDEATKLLGLKSWNEQTHITLDSAIDTPITVEYATNNGNGRGLNGYTVALANEIKFNQLTMATMLSE